MKFIPFSYLVFGSCFIVQLSTKVVADNIPLSQLTVPVPTENPITAQKRRVGKILFWDEQLSSDNSVACGSCHIPSAGGTELLPTTHPGPDGLFSTEDDVLGSHGIRHYDSNMTTIKDPTFGLNRQVTGRASPSNINAMFATDLFWDGRAQSRFNDPENSDITVISSGGALENQAIAPILSSVEMAKQGRTWSEVIEKLKSIKPLALATNIPSDIQLAIDSQPDYPGMFNEAFGDPEITAARIAMVLATYQRTLVPDQTPWDKYIAGDLTAMTAPQIAGWDMFDELTVCGNCHIPPLFTDNEFHNIGLRPADEDIGRQEVTQDNNDLGRFKTPSLRNSGIKKSLMHTGWVTSARDGLDFYNAVADAENGIDNRHHQFTQNQSGIPTATPGRFVDYDTLSLASQSEQTKANVADFMANALTDPRVANEEFPFDRPTLASERKFNESSLLSFMSYNIAGATNWSVDNAELIIETMQTSAVDVIGLQEAGTNPQQDLLPLLPENYEIITFVGNSMPIIYNKDKLFLVVSGSSTKDQLLWCVNDRYVNYAIFSEKTTGSQFIFTNTHFCATFTQSDKLPTGYTGEKVNQQHGAAMASFVGELTESWQLPVIISGDLNANVTSNTMAFLLEQQPLSDGATHSLILDDTWQETNTGTKAGVDWLLYSPNLTSIIYAEQLINDTTDVASDHYPVIARLLFNDDPATDLPLDSDNDGVIDDLDAFPLDNAESIDTDSDGVGNNSDTDDDGDSVADNDDAFPLDNAETIDTDSDGVGNNSDTDDDGDGVADNDDAFPLDNAESMDTDNDGVGDNSDTDDDGDGIADHDDTFPLDNSESMDTDSDGVGNNSDTDDDGDGVADNDDAFPLDASRSSAESNEDVSEAESSSSGGSIAWISLGFLLIINQIRYRYRFNKAMNL